MPPPDRWLAYTPIGKIIEGTRFICFKVPLKDVLCNRLQVNDRFTPQMLMDQFPNLGLVVDLTNTKRYYDGKVFQSKGIQYKKIFCPGKVVPPDRVLREFTFTVDDFLNNTKGRDDLIGVHCTHGLNRTGYLVCRYLNMRMGFTPKDAISAFEDARGHKMERELYIKDIFSAGGLENRDFKTRLEQWHMPQEGNSWNTNSQVRQHNPARRHNFNSNHYTGKYNDRSNYYPLRDPEYRRNNLEHESPLAASSHEYYNYSRYSRNYVSPRFGEGPSHLKNGWNRRPQNDSDSSRFRSNRGNRSGSGRFRHGSHPYSKE